MIKLYRAVRSCQAERTPRFFLQDTKLLKMLREHNAEKYKKKKTEKEKMIKYKGNILLLALFESQHHSNTL